MTDIDTEKEYQDWISQIETIVFNVTNMTTDDIGQYEAFIIDFENNVSPADSALGFLMYFNKI